MTATDAIKTETDGRLALAALLRDLSRLTASVSLDRDSDPTRTLPAISPATLWRIWPRVARRAAALAEAQAVPVLTRTEIDFLRAVAAEVEGAAKPAPVVAS